MPINAPKVFASVNTGTNEITFTAPHLLLTGDGFLAVYSPDGGTLPAPLVGVTNYWAIRISDTVVKLATSSTNAMAGTAIDLTTAGSGTLWLLQGLPFRIPRISAVGTQVDPDDFNAEWESMQALWAHKTGQAQTVWSDVSKVLIPAGAFAVTSGTATLVDGVWTPGTSLSLTRWEYALQLQAGVSIDSVQVLYVRHSLADISDSYTLSLRQSALAVGAALPAGSNLATVSVLGNGASNYPNIDALAVGPVTMPASTIVVIRFSVFMNSSSGTLAQFAGVKLATTRT